MNGISRARVGVAVIAVTALALAGCGRDSTGGGGSTESASPISEGPATGTVEVWAMGTEGEALQAFAADFVTENPDVEVNVTAVPWDAAHDKIATAIAAWQTFLPFAWQAGAQLTNEDFTEFTLDTPEMVAALTYYQSFFTDGLAPTDLPQGSLEPDFMAGKIASFVSGPWHVGILKELDAAGMENVALATLPAGEQEASFIGGANLAVFGDSEARDAAWKFVEWLSQPEVQVAWYSQVNDLPSVASAWEDPAIADDPYLTVFGAQLETALAPPSIPTWEEVASVIDTELERLCKSGADPQEVATTIQEQAAAIGTGL